MIAKSILTVPMPMPAPAIIAAKAGFAAAAIALALAGLSPSSAAAQPPAAPSVPQAPYGHAPLPYAPSYTGPSDARNLTVSRLKIVGRDDQYVALRGKLVRYMGDENYLFADATGSIRVEIDHEKFPYDRQIGADTLVDITGEFDREYLGHSKVDVETIRIVQQ